MFMFYVVLTCTVNNTLAADFIIKSVCGCVVMCVDVRLQVKFRYGCVGVCVCSVYCTCTCT